MCSGEALGAARRRRCLACPGQGRGGVRGLARVRALGVPRVPPLAGRVLTLPGLRGSAVAERAFRRPRFQSPLAPAAPSTRLPVHLAALPRVSASGRSFWESELEWQAAEAEKGFEVNVIEPRHVGGGMFSKSYTTYKVTSTVLADGVWRRYSDFEFMRDILVSRFHGLAIPLLPDKRVVGNLDEAFIERRRAGLADWARKIGAHPYLRGDATFTRFLSVTGDSEWEQSKKAAATGEGASSSSNPGLARWFGCLRMYPLPAESDKAVAESAALNSMLEDKCRALLTAVDAFLQATKQSVAAMEAIGAAFDSLAKGAVAATEKLGPVHESVKKETMSLADLSAKGHHAWTELLSLSKFADNEVQLFLLAAIANEIGRCQAFSSLLAVRKAAQDAFGRSSVQLNQLRFRQKQYKDKGDAPRAAQMEPELERATKLAHDMNNRLSDVTKGILLVEGRSSAIKRVTMLSQLFGCFAATQGASASTTQTIWKNFLAEAGLEKAGTIAKAQRVIDDLLDTDEYTPVLPAAPDSGFSIAPPPTGLQAGAAPASAAAAAAAASGAGSDGAAGSPAPAPAPAAAASPAAAAAASTPAASPSADEEEGTPAGNDDDDDAEEGDMF